jgi:hypothetical protein
VGASQSGVTTLSHKLPRNLAPSTTNTASSCITARLGVTEGGTGNGLDPSDRVRSFDGECNVRACGSRVASLEELRRPKVRLRTRLPLEASNTADFTQNEFMNLAPIFKFAYPRGVGDTRRARQDGSVVNL